MAFHTSRAVHTVTAGIILALISGGGARSQSLRIEDTRGPLPAQIRGAANQARQLNWCSVDDVREVNSLLLKAQFALTISQNASESSEVQEILAQILADKAYDKLVKLQVRCI